MENLAGNKDCDKYIKQELEQAGIDIVSVQKENTEVPYSLIGKLKTKAGDEITFYRAWYYWIARGNVDLELARKLYEHPEGKKCVRVDGHCGCPSPDNYHITFLDRETGKELINQSYLDCERVKNKDSKAFIKIIDEMEFGGKYKPVQDRTSGRPVITQYHIDSQAGLLLFSLVMTGKLNL